MPFTHPPPVPATDPPAPEPFADRCARLLAGHDRPLAWRLLVAALAVLAAALLHGLAFGPATAAAPHVLFLAAVVLAALYGGLAAGAFATALATLGIYALGRMGPLDHHDWFALAVFLASALCVALSAELLHRTLRALHHASAQIARAAAEWQATFDATNAAVWVLDRDCHILRVNRAAELRFGRTAAAMTGHRCWEIAHGSTTPTPGCPFLRARDSRRRETAEIRQGDHWCEVIVDPILDAAGAFAGAVHTVTDITARKNAEADRALLGDTIGGSLNEIYIFDATTLRFRYANAGALRNLGYASEQLLALTPLAITAEFDDASFAALLAPLRRAEQPSLIVECTNRRADGTLYPVEAHLQLLDHDGRPVFLAIVSDITRRRQLETEVRAAHADLERLVRERTAALAASNALLVETGRIARVGGWEHDLRTDTVDWTLPVRQLHEVDDSYRPTAESLTRFYEPEARPQVGTALERVRREGLGFDLELPFVTARGVPLWVRTTGQAYREGEAIVKVGGVIQDITARRRAEDELRQQRDQLEQFLAERTAANTRLRELDRLKSEFLSTMSHELRTPLNSIVGFTGILIKGLAGPLNPEQHKQLGLVQSSARHLLALINDLLDLSRIEAGRIELQRDAFDFATVVDEVVASIQPAATQKGVTLHSACTPAALPLVGDRRRSLQVLLNLATNAVKFTERGEVALAARLDAGRLVVAVRDTGIGIRPDQLPHLFEAFRQLDASARRHYEGTGLGLHLSRKLLEVLGGSIAVESAPGTGSTFTFTLPLSPP